MKRIISAVFLLFICSLSFGQLADQRKPFIAKQDRFITTLSLDGWDGLPSGITSSLTRSRGFSFLLMKDVMNNRGTAGFAYGIGFSSQNVHTNAFFSDSAGQTIIRAIPDSLRKKTNKLSLNFIDVAIEFRIHTQPNSLGNQWKFNAGFKAGYQLQDHVKYEDKNGKVKRYDTPNLNRLQYGLTARIGYSIFALSYYRSLVPVFEKNAAPELIPYSFGISLTL